MSAGRHEAYRDKVCYTRAMNSNEIYEAVTKKIVAALREGVIPWEREFTVEGGLHRSFATHKPYRGGNQFYLDLIARSEGYKSPFWITLNQIKKQGGSLKKINGKSEKGTGQKSSIVFFYKLIFNEETDPKTGKKVEKVFPFLKYNRVFNLDQVEGIEAPELPASEFTPEERAISISTGMENSPTIYPGPHGWSYDGSEDVVSAPAKELPVNQRNWRALFDCLVQSTAHSSRLNRTPEFGEDPEFSKERLIGEMGAAMLIGLTGISVPSAEVQQRKIDGWINALEEKPRLVVQAASKAQGAADYIVGPEEDDE